MTTHAHRSRTRTIVLIVLVLLLALLLVAIFAPRASQQGEATAAVPADTLPRALVALGDSIYNGRVAGGTCFACHRADGKGMAGLAPDLTDGNWLHGDGSLTFLETIIRVGVPKPKQAAAAMPPMGGAKLTPEQIKAVAAYVYVMSHPERSG